MKSKYIALMTFVLAAALNASAQVLPTSGVWPRTTLTADETVYLTGDVEIQGEVWVESGATLTIKIAEEVSSNVTIKRKANVGNFTMLRSNGGNITIKGTSDTKRVILDGNWRNKGEGIVIFANSSTKVELDYVKFTDNYKNEYGTTVGGNVWMREASGTVKSSFVMTNSIVENCVYTGGNNGGLFCFQSNKTYNTNTYPVTFENCTFTNNQVNSGATNAGGVIYADTHNSIKGTVNKCRFEGNSTKRRGAGICWLTDYPGIDVTECSFISGSAYQGGAIFADGKLNLSKCIFRNNSSTYEGGAIYAAQSFTIDDCDFDGNTSQYGGALLVWTLAAAEGVIKGGSTFTNNIAKHSSTSDGGAINLHKGRDGAFTFTMNDNCVLDGNKSENGNGGALYCKSENGYNQFKINISQISVTNNSSKLAGGGLYFGNGSYINEVNISNVTFSKDTSKTTFGGGIGIEGGISKLEIKNSSFTNNVANTNGGGIAATNTLTSATITNTPFTTNVATTGNGGAASLAGGTITLTDIACTQNSAVNGGALSFTPNTTAALTITGSESGTSTISNNIAATDGGGIYFKKTNSGDVSLTLTPKCIITNNTATAGRGGGMFFWRQNGSNNCSTTIKNNISSNTAQTGGGGVFIGGDNNINTVLIDNAEIKNNTSNTGNGGGLDVERYINTLTLSNSTFDTNKALDGNGGGSYIQTGDKIYFTDNEFKNNSASVSGGAAAIFSGNTVEISGGSYHDNTAVNGGAFASAIVGTLNLSILRACEIKSNTATTDGGAVYIKKENDYSATLTIGESEIASNTATNGNGGAIAFYRTNTNNTFTVTFSGGAIKSNKAENGFGGGVYVLAGTSSNRGIVNFTGAYTIGGDSASDANKAIDGGGVYLSCANVTINNGVIKNNIATGNGGGLYASETIGKINENSGNFSQIIGNKAVNGAGAYFSKLGDCLDVQHVEIKDNMASGNGGGLFVNGTYFDLNPSTSGKVTVISGNSAANGAGAYFSSLSKTRLSHAEIKGNTASGDGGGLYISGGTDHWFEDNAKYMKITENKALNGAGLYVTGAANCLVYYVLVSGNHAIASAPISTAWKSIPEGSETIQGVGGGVYVASGTSESARTTFTFNRTDVFGVYDNVADNGAAEIFADGAFTKLSIPTTDIKNVTLLGKSYKATAWYEDFINDDINYEESTMKGVKAGRYPSVISPVAYKSVNVNDKYISLTLGYPRSIIVKVSGLYKDESVVFTLTKEGSATPFESFALTGVSEDGSTLVTKTIKNLELGSWTVQESGWGWSYTSDPVSITKEVTGETTVEYPFSLTKSSTEKNAESKATNNFKANGFRVDITVTPREKTDGGKIGL